MNKKLTKFLLKAIISLILLIILFFSTDWQKFFKYLKNIDLFYSAMYVVIYLVGMVISSVKWHIISKLRGIKGKFRTFFDLYVSGTFINNFMPSFIGGDAFKAYQIGKKDKNYFQSASTVIIDRVTGFIGVGILVMFFATLNFKFILTQKYLLIFVLTIAFGFLFGYIIYQTRNIKPLRLFIRKKLPTRLGDIIKQFYEINRDKKPYLEAILISIIFNFIGVGICNLMLFFAFDIKIDLNDYFSVIFLISLVSAIPISINNIGIKEWAYINFFCLFSVEKEAALSVVIVGRFFQMIVSLYALPVYLRGKDEFMSYTKNKF